METVASDAGRQIVGEPARQLKIAVFDCQPYDSEAFERCIAKDSPGLSTLKMAYLPVVLSADTISLAKDCDAICIGLRDECDAVVLGEAAKLGIKLVLLRSDARDCVDVKAAQSLGISVVGVPTHSPHTVAEFVVGQLLCLNRKIHQAYNRVRDGNFTLSGLQGFDIHGKVIGVMGVGRIGKCLIDIMIAFGCKILAYDEIIDDVYAAKPEVTYVPLDDLLQKSDVVSIHLPHSDSTHHIINANSLRLMKPNSILINTSHSGVVDTAALIEALKHKAIAGAALDVYEEDSQRAYFLKDHSTLNIVDDKLARLSNIKNVLITCRQSSFTNESLAAAAYSTLKTAQQKHKTMDRSSSCPTFFTR